MRENNGKFDRTLRQIWTLNNTSQSQMTDKKVWYNDSFKAHFHSRKISTDRKFSENIIVKSWKFSTSKYFSDVKFVSANQILQNFLSAEHFPEWKWALRLSVCVKNWKCSLIILLRQMFLKIPRSHYFPGLIIERKGWCTWHCCLYNYIVTCRFL